MWTYLKRSVRLSLTKSRRERGQSLAEYGLVLILVGIVVVLALVLFGETVRAQYCEIVYSLDSEIDADVCNVIDVECVVIAPSPFQMRAQVDGDYTVERVRFYADGEFVNEEYYNWYCLQGGNGPCDTYPHPGEHTFSAVVYTEEGVTGQCSLTATVP